MAIPIRISRAEFLARSRAAFHSALYESGAKQEDLSQFGFSRAMLENAANGTSILSEQSRYAASLLSSAALLFCQNYARKLWDLDVTYTLATASTA